MNTKKTERNYQREFVKSRIKEDIKSGALEVDLDDKKIELLCDIIMNDDSVWSELDYNLNETFNAINEGRRTIE